MARTKKSDTKATMSVAEAGRLGGKKTSSTHGRAFYEQIGHKGGQRVRELINQGKSAEASKRK